MDPIITLSSLTPSHHNAACSFDTQNFKPPLLVKTLSQFQSQGILVDRQIEVAKIDLSLNCAMDEAIFQAMYYFTLCHRFGEGSNVYLTRLPTEMADLIRRFLRIAIREFVGKATATVLRCMMDECGCSAMPFSHMSIHRRAMIVHAEICYERVSLLG